MHLPGDTVVYTGPAGHVKPGALGVVVQIGHKSKAFWVQFNKVVGARYVPAAMLKQRDVHESK